MCDLTLYRDCDRSSISVSNFFIDEYLADANDAQIKVYLYLIRMFDSGRTTNISDIADKFNHTEKDVCRALRYWEKKGILSLDFDKNGGIVGIQLHEPARTKKTSDSFIMQPVNIVKEAPTIVRDMPGNEQNTDTVTPSVTHVKPTYSLDELKAFKNRQETPQLIFIAEQYLKKTLSANDVRSILFYTDELNFSVDLIDYLLQFCAGRKKTSFAYIDRVATDWAENNIATVKQAKNYTSQFEGSSSSGSNIRSYNSNKNTTFHKIEKSDIDFDELERQLLSR